MSFESELAAELAARESTTAKQPKTTKREKLAERYHWRCWWCSQKLRRAMGWQNSATIDHVVPVSAGGCNRFWNLVAACYRCNYAKQAVHWEEFAYNARNFGVDTRTVDEARHAALKACRRERESARLCAKQIQPPSVFDRAYGWYLQAVYAAQYIPV